mmetsp:Transcript_15685/g.27057  ORF Transcript_15685/g.27057 Transcript_15685/m.27057 type:complete len:213 (+) Transcript_15685:534-1172(+)
MEVLHPIVLEGQVDDAVAAAPFLADTQLLLGRLVIQEGLDGREVVAKGRLLTLDAHVIGVVACELVRDQLAVIAERIGSGAGVVIAIVAGLDLLHAWHACSFHCQGACPADDTFFQGPTLRLAAIVRHVGVPLVLLLRIRQAIPDAQTLQRHFEAIAILILLPDVVGHRRHVVASIGLAENEEVQAFVLGESFVELLHEVVHVLGHTIFVMD